MKTRLILLMALLVMMSMWSWQQGTGFNAQSDVASVRTQSHTPPSHPAPPPSRPMPPIYRPPAGPPRVPQSVTRPVLPSGVHPNSFPSIGTHGPNPNAVSSIRTHVIAPGIHTHGVIVASGGRYYSVPQGGWVTWYHQHWPHLHTCLINPYPVPWGTVVWMNDFWTPYWGFGWWMYPYGFYWGDYFWMGYPYPTLWQHDYSLYPVYIYAPISEYDYGPVTAPAGGFTSDEQVDLAVLSAMAAYNASDPTAGLYVATQPFDPAMPGSPITAGSAFDMLKRGEPVYYHPPGGAFEELTSLSDLRAYMYLRESRSAAPAQETQP